jgi:hypothetical protein
LNEQSIEKVSERHDPVKPLRGRRIPVCQISAISNDSYLGIEVLPCGIVEVLLELSAVRLA